VNDYTELRAMTDRLCKLMEWEPGTSHKFEIIRQTCSGKAAALSIEKGNEIADKLEELMKAVCDYKLANIGQEFLEGMAELMCDECGRIETPPYADGDACICGEGRYGTKGAVDG